MIAVGQSSRCGKRQPSAPSVGVRPGPRTSWSFRRGRCVTGENAGEKTDSHPLVRGRSPVECPVPVRNEVIQFLHRVTGPSVGLPALRCLFPGIRRCVLEDLLVRYRRIWRRRYMQRGFRLNWHHAGAVWAMDHSEPLQPVDGVSPYLLAVRDLASHRQLAWHPVQTVTAEETLPILLDLFRQYGPPLVLKNDNGSAFIAEMMRHAMLSRSGDPALLSRAATFLQRRPGAEQRGPQDLHPPARAAGGTSASLDQ